MSPLCLSLLFLFGAHCMAHPVEPSSNASFVLPPTPSPNFYINLQELGFLAMDPDLNNQSLLELYQESAEIINGTTANSVLYALDPVNGNNSNSSTPPILVMAVYNPSSPSHDDLLSQFKLYFANVSETPVPTTGYTQDGFPMSELVSHTKQTTWSVVRNFFKNQMNAVVSAFWLPYKVGAQAMQQTSNEHAEYVKTGTTFGSTLAMPYILSAVALPTNIAQRVVNITTGNVDAIKAVEAQSKNISNQAVDVAANGVATAAEASSRLAVQYLVRPLGAFAGFHLNLAGQSLTGFGQRLDGASGHLAVLGQQLGKGGVKAVDAGASAIAWSLDNKVVLPSEQRTHNGTDAGPMHVSTRLVSEHN